MARFKRILLKLSGESLMGKQGYGIDPERLSDYTRQIKEVSEMGVQIGIVTSMRSLYRICNCLTSNCRPSRFMPARNATT